eukprot:g17979.t1
MEQFLTDRKASLPVGGAPYAYGGGRIRFENVRFRALQGLDLEIPAGAKVGIVGPSGSGKSTILKLLARVAAPEAGRTLVDGQDLMVKGTENAY